MKHTYSIYFRESSSALGGYLPEVYTSRTAGMAALRKARAGLFQHSNGFVELERGGVTLCKWLEGETGGRYVWV